MVLKYITAKDWIRSWISVRNIRNMRHACTRTQRTCTCKLHRQSNRDLDPTVIGMQSFLEIDGVRAGDGMTFKLLHIGRGLGYRLESNSFCMRTYRNIDTTCPISNSRCSICLLYAIGHQSDWIPA